MPERRNPVDPREIALQRAIAQALTRRPITRRNFLHASLLAGTAATLAACGIPAASPTAAPTGTPRSTPTPGATPGATAAATPTAEPTATAAPSPAGQLNFANWPLYIDADDPAESLTLQQFQQDTGITVNYTEAIEDNQSFFGTIQPALAAGQDTGWDLMVLTDWLIGNMIRLGYLHEIDVASQVPNFVANAADKYKNPTYDPNNRHSVPWQSGITGIAYNPELVEEEITSLAQLLDPALAERYSGRIGMFTEMRDTMNLAVLYLGVDPINATVEDAERARDALLAQAPHVRDYYGNEYAEGLADGSLALTMAWSGDVFQLQFDNPDLRFVVPNDGGILWVDNMCIPRNAQHPVDATMMMNYVYEPEIAAQIAEYVNYICPVPAARDIILRHADEAESEEDAEYLRAVAESPLVFPTDDMLARLHSYKVLDEAEERSWNELFNEVVTG